MKQKLFFIFALIAMAINTMAQEIRYVNASTGDYKNDGKSWATPKKNIQDAINDLVANHMDGEVWVAAGTYKPTESTESSGINQLNMSFKIPAGITVRGGFKDNLTADADKKDDGTTRPKDANGQYTNVTTLTGSLKSEPTFTFTNGKFKTSFYENCYHVVWFAMNGFGDDGRAKALAKKAMLEGCTVKGGHAFNTNINGRSHNGYGGGIYMVANSYVQNCIVENCDASRNGGGIYMDGGGEVRHTTVKNCQALGVGIDYGFGGGICAEGNSSPYYCVVTQSVINNCVGRMGGGMAFYVHAEANKNHLAANATLIHNNTSTNEGGGVYLYKGGALANLTIVSNKTNGSGVNSNGVENGQTGGVFGYDYSNIGNCVLWGNERKDPDLPQVQYATSRSSNSLPKHKFRYNALSHAELADWSNTERKGVKPLCDHNTGTENDDLGHVMFKTPATAAGYYTGATDYHIESESVLRHAGIATIDLDHEGETPAPEKNYDIDGQQYNSRCTLGSFCSPETLNIGYATNGSDVHFYVDPNYTFGQHTDANKGVSWTTPTRYLANVLEYIKEHASEFSTKNVYVHIKEGIVDNTNSNDHGRVRLGSINVPSNVTILGGYSKESTSTNLNLRNPIAYPTIISGYVTDGEHDYNVAHLITLNNVQNVTIDGVKIEYANATSTVSGSTNKDGGAVTIIGSTNNIKFKNIIIANNQADHGAAVYADASTANFENCVFHNNTTSVVDGSGLIYGINNSRLSFDHCNVLRSVGHASYLDESTTNNWKNSMFYGNLDRAQDNTNNCNEYSVAAFEGPGATSSNITGERNMFDLKSRPLYDAKYNTNGFNLGSGIPDYSTYYVRTTSKGAATTEENPNGLEYAYTSGWANGYPRMVNPTKNAGVSWDGDITYYGRATSFEPHNDNPVVNAASYSGTHDTWGKDLTDIITRDFGGLPDIGAVESHVASADETINENSNPDGQMPYGGVLYVRDYTSTGTPMDTFDKDGAGNLSKNTYGLGLYKENGEFLDGTSWDRAINGNAVYQLSGTRTYKDVTDVGVLAYRINNNNYYLDIKSETLNRIDGRPTTNESGEPYNPSTTCSVFILCDENGNELLYNSGKTPTSAKRLKDASTGEYLYLDYTNGVYSFRTSANPPAAQALATITGTTTYKIQYKANNQSRYIFNNNNLASASATSWTFTQENNVTIKHGNGDKHSDVPYDMGNFTGLQYAVNKANIAFQDDYSLTDNRQKSKKQVWVGAGVYMRDPAKNIVANPIVEMDEENCFVIQDGVDVFGAFPKKGNPGMEQREALVSQYVHVEQDRNCDATEYETILQPATAQPATPDNIKRRVLGQPYKYNPDKGNDGKRGLNNGILYCGTDYVGIVWDGFTIRNGYWASNDLNRPNRYGGAGAAIYRNVTLKNCVVTNNTTIYINPSQQQDYRAGGIYLDGGTVDAGYIINNEMVSYTSQGEKTNMFGAAYGGGMYIYTGTVFNSVISNNHIYAGYSDGAGLFMENSNFFNNTIVNNEAEGNYRASGGISIWTDPGRGTDSRLTLYNCIIAKNEGYKGETNTIGNKNTCIPREGLIEFFNCLTEAADEITKNKSFIKFNHCSAINDFTNIFEAAGSYNGNFKYFNLRLKSTASAAINTGIQVPVIGGVEYNLTDYNDMDFAARIQDCNIDIGAYEFNGATNITPDETTVPGQAIYYVTPNGYGTTSANDPENAACAQKLQRVLDAAGRYKYQNPNKQVIVKVANSYSLLHPNNVSKQPGDDGYIEPTDFNYYACRTTDQSSTDTRMWSIIIPRGVEVWGGYTDVALNDAKTSKITWTNYRNGFYNSKNENESESIVYTDLRDVLGNPTYFASYFYNRSMKINAIAYHVATFSDHVFDRNGLPLMANDNITDLSSYTPGTHDESEYMHMTTVLSSNDHPNRNVQNIGTDDDPTYISSRAVLDGIFISGGNADGKAIAGSNYMNINGCGGAAIVNEYAHVRNCIVTGNNAKYGGGFAVSKMGIISGTLIVENTADYGGGIYVFEEGTQLSDGTTVSTTAPYGKVMDYNMPHIFTSTIANNTAEKQGGGMWFTTGDNPNVRVASSVFWGNTCDDQANVYGNLFPEKSWDDHRSTNEFYPFSYSAITNLRASGQNNLSVSPNNINGVRFAVPSDDLTKYKEVLGNDDPKNFKIVQNNNAEMGYYGLSNYSILNRTGMPVQFYESMLNTMAVSPTDFTGRPRMGNSNIMERRYVEIGARALDKVYPQKEMMLRIFVAKAEDVDMDAAQAMMQLAADQNPEFQDGENYDSYTDANYYSQEGSSFAYPMQSLQDALDYVQSLRSTTSRSGDAKNLVETFHGNNLPFEILVAKGTYYPTRSITDNYTHSYSNTFVIPEGVTIVGGFDSQGGCTFSSGSTKSKYSYYGRFYKRNTSVLNTYSESATSGWINNNVTALAKNNSKTISGLKDKNGDDFSMPFEIQEWPIEDIENRRAHDDNNGNSIIEPWEFKNQTILSGNTTNTPNKGVYHVLTAVADQNIVGMLPKPSIDKSGAYDGTGYTDKEEGQTIHLNGLVVSGGYAMGHENNALDELSQYTFYQGGGLLVEGNRYCDAYNKATGDEPKYNYYKSDDDKEEGVVANYPENHRRVYAIGYRDIPLSIANCKFLNNYAGYGGAIASNGTLDIFASSFERNLAAYGKDENVKDALGDTHTVEYPGEGGAIHATHQLSCFNTLFANNEARSEGFEIEPQKHGSFRVAHDDAIAIPRGAGGAIQVGTAGHFHIVNCDFVRNKANMYPAVQTMNPTAAPVNDAALAITTPEYSQLINTVAWGNEVNEGALNNGNEVFKFASKLMVNAGLKNRTQAYNATFGKDTNGVQHAPTDMADLEANFQECAWFCAYEDGVGFTPKNDYDFRELDYRPYTFATNQIKAYAQQYKDAHSLTYMPNDYYQNCNIRIDKENSVLEGPNFRNPSRRAGVDGYMESADWSPARLNNLTDNGSGRLEQTYSTQTKDVTFLTYADANEVPNRSDYSSESVGDYKHTGGYTITHYVKSFPEYKNGLAIGNDYYMESATITKKDANDNEVAVMLPRIAPMPDPKVRKAYIDIGVYEYMHAPFITGDEVDVLWVSTEEHPENGMPNGQKWDTPTSDLQRAIETLLSSRNGHKKEIRIMEGEYAPTKTVDVNGTNYQSFFIDTKGLNESAFIPEYLIDQDNLKGHLKEQFVSSLTIKGGYSSEVPYTQDVEKYPTIIRQQESTSASTDHLFYIADATQRYGIAEDCNEESNYGAWPNSQEKETNTFPIHIDGITFINKNASQNAEGSAIYYPDRNDDATSPTSTKITTGVQYYKREQGTSETNDEYNSAAISPDNAPTDYFKVTGSQDVNNPAKLIISKVIVLGSGKAGDNVGEDSNERPTGSAVYIGEMGGNTLIYNSVFHSNYGNPLEAYNATTINNTFAENAGIVVLKNASYTGSVNSQMLNSILWLNNPQSGSDTPYGVQFILPEYSSDAASGSVFANNAYTGGDTSFTDYGAASGIKTNNYNVGLVAQNNDVINGPNFVDPYNEDIEKRYFNLLPSLRILNKGDQTDSSTGTNYYVEFDSEYPTAPYVIYDLALETTTGKEAAYTDRLIGKARELGAYEYQKGLQRVIYVDPNKGSSDSDDGNSWEKALGKGKIQDAIDIAAVYNVNEGNAQGKEAYVFVKGASETNKGLDTEETLTLRNGVTVYGSIPSTYNTEIEHDDADDGVIPYDDDKIQKFETQMKHDREGVANPSANKTTINGIVTSPSTTFASNVEDPTNPETPDNIATVIDGFDVTKGNTDTPVIDINPSNPGAGKTIAPIVLTNLIVRDNTIGEAGKNNNVNIANVDNALIYEVLMRDNFYSSGTAKPTVLNLGANAYAVNVTVEGETKYNNSVVVALNGGETAADEATSHVHASLVNYGEDAPTDQTLSKTHYALEDKNLNYQLEEMSKHIDGVDQVCTSEGVHNCNNPKHYLPENLAKFVNYQTDRDLLGNPRLIAGITNTDRIDRGAFETWKVDNTVAVFICGDDGTIANKDGYVVSGSAPYSDADQKILNIKKHYYPHDGSVVYIMKNQSLVIDPVNSEHEVKPTPHNPGFMLVQEGANFYGNGRPATCAFVAIERKVRKGGAVVSVPYQMYYEGYKPYEYDADKRNEYKLGNQIGVGAPAYNPETGILNITADRPNAYTYNQGERSDWQYDFAKESSACWDAIADNTVVDANNGVLYVPADKMYPTQIVDEVDKYALLRFTGKGVSMSDYIYTENGVSKEIVLTQHNNGGRDNTNAGGRAGNDPSGSGNGETISVGNNYVENGNSGDNADFTDNLDMGWNCFGIPYLVSDYKPYNTVTVNATNNSVVIDNTVNAEHPYQMQIPHTLWLYYDGVHTPDFDPETDDVDDKLVDGDGGFYSVGSWESSKDAWHVSSDAEKTLWVGEGFFAQTATLSTDRQETMTFYRPVYTEPSAGARERSLTRYYVTDGNGEIDGINQTTVADGEIIDTRYYTTDGVQIEKPLRHGVTIIRDIYSNGASKTRKSYK